MKKLIVALAMFPLVASATELGAGTFQLRGDSTLGFSSETQEIKANGATLSKTDSSTLNFGVEGFYYLAPGLGIGAVVSYDNQSVTDKTPGSTTNGAKQESTTLLIGPAVAFDYALTHEVGLFAEGAVGYASGSQKSSGPGVLVTDTFKFSGYGVRVAGGVKYFLERHFSFDAGLAYEYLSMKSSQDTFGKPSVTNGIFGVNLGLSVYFGGK